MSELSEAVRRRYAEVARTVAGSPSGTVGGPSEERGCCGSTGAGCGCGGAGDPITRDLYAAEETSGLPGGALAASLGCGNPSALAELRPGEVVLDLGSGGGIDVLLSARRVAPEGRAYGLDMTPEMLELARRNQREAGVENAEFLEGRIEQVPLPDGSVDVVISNCVINLSGDKRRALAEAFRVLRPGGRLAVSDVVVRGKLPPEVRRSMELWAGCIAGALEEDEFRSLLAEVGFEALEIEETRRFTAEEAGSLLEETDLDPAAVAPGIEGRLISAFVRARKPDAPRG